MPEQRYRAVDKTRFLSTKNNSQIVDSSPIATEQMGDYDFGWPDYGLYCSYLPQIRKAANSVYRFCGVEEATTTHIPCGGEALLNIKIWILGMHLIEESCFEDRGIRKLLQFWREVMLLLDKSMVTTKNNKKKLESFKATSKLRQVRA